MDASHLLDEVDRQLGEQRAQADAFATRAGLMVAASAVLTTLLSRTLSPQQPAPGAALWIIGGAAALGILVLSLSRLIPGPSPTQITRWSAETIVPPTAILDAKLLTIQANSRALVRTETVFGAQAVATLVGILMLILRIQGSTP
jgi:hypothetical protein